MKKVLKVIWHYMGWIYFPVYLLAIILHKIARLLLAISYFGLLNGRIGKDIINNLFTKSYGRYY